MFDTIGKKIELSFRWAAWNFIDFHFEVVKIYGLRK